MGKGSTANTQESFMGGMARSITNLARKRSFDGLKGFIAEEAEEEHHRRLADRLSSSESTHPTSTSISTSANATTLPSTSMPTHSVKSTPGFPRGLPSSSSASSSSSSTMIGGPGHHTHTIGISSGLSESSRRFRSAFRLNKSRGAESAASGSRGGGGENQVPGTGPPGTGGVARRAMRVPIRATKGDDHDGEEQDEDEERGREKEGEDSSGAEKSKSAL